MFTVIKPPDRFLFGGDILPTPFLIHPSLYLMNHFWAARYFVSTSFVAVSYGLAPLLPCLEKAFMGGGGIFSFIKDAIRRVNKAVSRRKTRKEAEA